MNIEEKDLLLKDLCARLKYGVKASVYSYWNEEYVDDYIVGVDIEEDDFLCSTIPGVRCEINLTKPYLFPMSSMTEEQKEEHKDLLDNLYSFDANGNIFTLQDFYCKYHLDFRGLIPMGLAIDATNLNIY